MRRFLLIALGLVALAATAVIAENEIHVNRAQRFNAAVTLAGAGNVISGSTTITSPTVATPAVTGGTFASPALSAFTATGANVLSSGSLTLTGATANALLAFTASSSELRATGPIRVTNNTLSTRYALRWVAGQRGKPSLNADIQAAAESTRMIADPDFEILGNNASSDDSTFYAEGGIQLQTDGGGTDSVILLPHLDANQSAWAQVTWGTDKETEWEADLSTAADITAIVIWAGLKLTNTATTATDNDQVFFRFAPATNSGKWQAIYSIGGTDTETDAGVTVVAATRYHFKVAIDASRIARMYINGVLVNTSTALSNTTDLIPYIGVLESGAAAKTIYVHGEAISRVCN